MAYNINIYGENQHQLNDVKTTSFVSPAPKGAGGSDGEQGTSLYFVDYDLLNDYYKDIVIKKITNNIMLSSDADVKQEGREYINGDLILCYDRSMYMIKKDNGVVDLEFIGKLQDENIVKDFKDKIINILIEYRKSTYLSALSYRLYTEDSNNGPTELPTIILKPSIYTTNTIDDSKYDYYLRIHLYNKKTLVFDDYTFKKGLSDNYSEYDLSLSDNHIDFYKKMEFRLVERYKDDNGFFSDFNDDYTITLSETSLDKLHPSGNNINICTSKDEGSFNIKRAFDDYVITKEVPSSFNNKTNYEVLHTQVQFTTRKINGKPSVNFRGGESCYFWSIEPKNSAFHNLEQYVNNITSDDYSNVYDEMINFLTSDKNIFELVCVNKTNKKIEIVDLKNSNIKYKFKEIQ